MAALTVMQEQTNKFLALLDQKLSEQEFNHPPKQTAAGSFPPRMSSFKQKQASKSPVKSPRSARIPSHKGPAPPPPIRSLSHDSEPRRPDELPIGTASQRSFSERHYPNPQRDHQDPPTPQRSISHEDPPQKYNRSHTVNAQMVGRHSVKQKQPDVSSNQDFRNRTHSAGSAQNDFTRALKMAIGNRAEQEKQNAVRQNSSIGSMEKTRNYAEIDFSPGHSPTVKSPVFISEENSKGNYAGIYIDDTDEAPNVQKTVKNNVDAKNSVNKTMHYQQYELDNPPTNINGYHDNNKHVRRRLLSDDENNPTNDRHEPGDYEDMEFRQNSISVKSTTSKSGYEDMTSHFPRPDFESPPPELPLKGKGPALPLKRSNTAPSHRHNDEKPPTILPTKSRERPVYENQQLKVQVNRTSSTGSAGSISPRSPNRLPNAFPVYLHTPPAHDGRSSPSDQRASRTEQEVFDWLTELKLTCYFDVFKTHGFDMISIQAITPEDLSYLEVHKMGHRKKLLAEIAKLSFSEQRLPNHKPRDVGSWLGLLNLRQYEPNFVEGGFDDMDFIKDLDKNDLEMIDIKKRGHQKKLLLAVQRLNDLELTAVLDIAVLESPIKRAPSFTNRPRDQQQTNPSVFQFPPPPTNHSPQKEEDPEDTEETMSATVASPRSPPPATAAKPGKAPVPVPSPKPKMNGEAPQPARKPSIGPSVKPKPKPAPKPPASPAANLVSGEIQGSQEEIVKSSKSRDFFKQQEKKVLDDSPNSTIDRRGSQTSIERRSSQSSAESISPTGTIIKKKPAVPPPAPKPKPHIEEPAPAPPVAVKKAPPPAPPKRGDSISAEQAPPPQPPVAVAAPPEVSQPAAPAPPTQQPSPPPPVSPTLPPPPPEEPKEPADVCFSPPMPAFIPPPPPTESPEPEVEENLPPPPADILDESQGDMNKTEDKEIKKAFDETDDLLSDIMADLDDFSSQIDNMF